MSPRNVEPNGCPHPQHSDYSSCPKGTMHCWRAPICGREASRIPAAFHGLWRVAQWLGTEEAEDVAASIRIRAKVAAHQKTHRRCGWCNRLAAVAVAERCNKHPQCTPAVRAERLRLFPGSLEPASVPW